MMHFKNYHQLIITEKILTLIFSDSIIADAVTTTPTASNKSRFERIYSRKKRFVVFPPGSAVLATMSLLKSLSPTTPSGINFMTEIEFYYPLQTTISEWYPKEPVEPMEKVESEDPPDNDNNSVEESHQRTVPQRSRHDKDESLYWQQNAVHRDRRDILGHIERVASDNGFEIKSCLLRVICEANHYLLPPGQSFLQDVLRRLLTTTHRDNVPDEYSQTMKVSEEECINEYGSKCQYSILDILLQ